MNSILQDYLIDNQKIDFISNDVEWQEFLILESFDFEKYEQEWILTGIWDFFMDKNENGEVYSLLKSKDYSPKGKTLNTVFYKRGNE